MRTTRLVILGLAAACGTSADNGGGSSRGSESTSASQDATAAAVDGSTGSTSAGSEAGGSGADEDTGPCQDCDDPPELRWMTEAADYQAQGYCLDVVADGSGGLVASYYGEGFSILSGDVIAVDARGVERARQGYEGRLFTGLLAREGGFFEWVSNDGTFGVSDPDLATLTGGALGPDVAALWDLAGDGDRRAYLVELPGGNPFVDACLVRIEDAVFVDSPALPCPDFFEAWRLHFDGFGNVIAALAGQYHVVRLSPDGLPFSAVESRWNRIVYDVGVAGDGTVWLVGAVGTETSPIYGAFVAKHGPDLSDEPLWEGVEQDDTDVRWRALVMRGDEPIVVGEDAEARVRLRRFTTNGDERWTIPIPTQPATVFRGLTINPDGDLLACGTRYTGEITPIGNDITYPVLAKLGS